MHSYKLTDTTTRGLWSIPDRSDLLGIRLDYVGSIIDPILTIDVGPTSFCSSANGWFDVGPICP